MRALLHPISRQHPSVLTKRVVLAPRDCAGLADGEVPMFSDTGVLASGRTKIAVSVICSFRVCNREILYAMRHYAARVTMLFGLIPNFYIAALRRPLLHHGP